jgi:hypothetical protein
VNVGVADVDELSVTGVPAVCIHRYATASPSASRLALASRVTVALRRTD